MSADLTSLLASSRALTSHVTRPDLPSINLGLDQIEAQSRRLVPRQPNTAADTGKAYVCSNFVSSVVGTERACFRSGTTYWHERTLTHRLYRPLLQHSTQPIHSLLSILCKTQMFPGTSAISMSRYSFRLLRRVEGRQRASSTACYRSARESTGIIGRRRFSRD